MKNLLAAVLILAAANVNAAAVAQAFNNSGGVIELTDEPCDAESYVASTAEADGSGREMGCYVIRGGKVLIFWHVLERVLPYPVEIFRPLSSS